MGRPVVADRSPSPRRPGGRSARAPQVAAVLLARAWETVLAAGRLGGFGLCCGLMALRPSPVLGALPENDAPNRCAASPSTGRAEALLSGLLVASLLGWVWHEGAVGANGRRQLGHWELAEIPESRMWDFHLLQLQRDDLGRPAVSPHHPDYRPPPRPFRRVEP